MVLTDQMGTIAEEVTLLGNAKYLASVARSVLIDFYLTLYDKGQLLWKVTCVVDNAVFLNFLDVDVVYY